MVPVLGWTVCLTENPLQPDLFQLADHQRGKLYSGNYETTYKVVEIDVLFEI